MAKKKPFSKEVIDICVSLYNNGVSVQDICKEYGCSSQSIYKWVNKDKDKPPVDNSLSNDTKLLQNEVIELRKQLRESEEAVYILKKALSFFQ